MIKKTIVIINGEEIENPDITVETRGIYDYYSNNGNMMNELIGEEIEISIDYEVKPKKKNSW